MVNEIQNECQAQMEGSIEHMKHDFKSLRTGKVTTQVLDNIKVDYYGTPTALDQVASVLATDATTIVISPWEKHLVADIESAIAKANIGVNPNNDGETVKLFFPPMTVEQRQETVKKMKGMGEDAKVSVRNDRKKANDKIKKLEKDKEITGDESKGAQDQVQKITDSFIGQIDAILKDKEAEILKV
ncbi:MAG: ribosome recycling factor [Campylobacterota bacterium]|nr:ribosome recycling factor [Campylobacterota bacterium]